MFSLVLNEAQTNLIYLIGNIMRLISDADKLVFIGIAFTYQLQTFLVLNYLFTTCIGSKYS